MDTNEAMVEPGGSYECMSVGAFGIELDEPLHLGLNVLRRRVLQHAAVIEPEMIWLLLPLAMVQRKSHGLTQAVVSFVARLMSRDRLM